MKSKISFSELVIRFRENVLHSSITEVSPNGVWIELPSGELEFIAKTNLSLMANFLLKVTAYEKDSSNV